MYSDIPIGSIVYLYTHTIGSFSPIGSLASYWVRPNRGVKCNGRYPLRVCCNL